MKPETFAALTLVVILVLFGGWYLYQNMDSLIPQEPERIPIAQPPVEEPKRLPMPAHNPVPPPRKLLITEPDQPIAPPFPKTLEDSDAYLEQRLPQVVRVGDLLPLLRLDHFIEKLVLFIDQLPGKDISRQHLPLKPPQAGFLTTGKGEKTRIADANYKRYSTYVALVETIPQKPLLHLYRGLYPQFQQAYQEINPKGHFNDRLIEVIEHLLQTPEPKGAIYLQPHIKRFRFADPQLESLSAGQKILLRMGSENRRRVKARLQELRDALIRKY